MESAVQWGKIKNVKSLQFQFVNEKTYNTVHA